MGPVVRLLANPPWIAYHAVRALLALFEREIIARREPTTCLETTGNAPARSLMMTIDDTINSTVMMMIFHHEGLEAAGIKERKFYAKVVGRDSIGLWIENPKMETTRVRFDNGLLIPPDQRQHEEHLAYVLIPWGNIRSVAHFPAREDFDNTEDEEASALGSGLYL